MSAASRISIVKDGSVATMLLNRMCDGHRLISATATSAPVRPAIRRAICPAKRMEITLHTRLAYSALRTDAPKIANVGHRMSIGKPMVCG